MSEYKYKDQLVLQFSASTTATEKAFDVVKISSITNFGEKDLLISFDKNFTPDGNDYLIVEAGGTFNYADNEEVGCDKIYFKTADGTTDFQIIGFRNWGLLPNSFN